MNNNFPYNKLPHNGSRLLSFHCKFTFSQNNPFRKFAKLETIKVPVITKKRNTSLFERINNVILNDINMDYEQMYQPLQITNLK